MALIQSTAIPPSGATDFDIPYSARFNGSTTKLTRTPTSTGNRRMLTFSAWIKQADVSTSINGNAIFSAGVNGDNFHYQSGQLFRHTGYVHPGNYWGMKDWNGKQRDSGGWKHIVVRFDTAQATETNRIRMFVNGVEPTLNHTYYTVSQNYDMRYNHTADAHWLGALNNGSYFDGYMAEVHWIDGAIVSPNEFGEFGEYGEWKPKKVTGLNYGTNGYYLDFADSSHFGKDVSGNGNNFTDTGFGTHDQMLDSPTNNFATLNPLDPRRSGYTVAEGNLYAYRSAGVWQPYFGTMGMPSGKWYWEAFYKAGYDAYIGAVVSDWDGTGNLNTTGVYTLYNVSNGTGYKYDNGVQSYGGAAWHWSTNKILQVAYDADTGKMWIGEENTWYSSGNPSTGANPFFTVSAANRGNLIPAFSGYDAATKQYVNFGQDSSFAGEKTAQGNTDTSDNASDFYYTPPTDFLALNVKNLPDATVVPSEHFNTVLYSGNGATSHAITGVGFQTDFNWIKRRNGTNSHVLHDSVRGKSGSNYLYLNSNAANAEAVQTDEDGVSSFDSDGFTVGYNGSGIWNNSSGTYISWNWKANGSGSSNTNGTINTISTSANVDSGFSIVKWVGNEGSDDSLGHGLSKAPEMIITCNLDEGWGWAVYHKDMGTDTFLILSENSAAEPTDTNIWADTAPTSSLFYVGTDIMTNWDDRNYIGYCFHSVDGYSKVGSYTGNGNADGVFVNTGFRPKWILMKNVSRAGSWYLVDTEQDSGFNSMTTAFSKHLLADTTGAQDSPSGVDFLSNGFKLRTAGTGQNYNTDTIIYLAIAETPFKNSNAR